MKVLDMHCDTVAALYERRQRGEEVSLLENSGHVDLRRLKQGNYLLQNFAVFVHTRAVEDPMKAALAMIDLYYEELALSRDMIAPVFSRKDLEENIRAGRMSALLTLEEGAVCQGELSALRNFYRLGVRMMTLTWNYRNEIGCPNIDGERMDQESESAVPFFLTPETEKGITKRGEEFLAEMERIGMIIDVSHLSDAGFYDVLRLTKKPFVASHSNARSISGWVRNMTDDMIRKLAERGGVIGLNFCPDFLTYPSEPGKPVGTVEAVIRHAKHIVNVGGIDCLGLGGDLDGIEGHEELKDCSGVSLLEEQLLLSGFTAAQTDQILGGNVLRLYRELLEP